MGTPDYHAAFRNVTREHGFEALRVEGAVPPALRGTFVRNGPGLLELFGRRYGHWFDGDGLLSAVRFDDDGATGAVQMLETPGLLEERRRGKPYFGAFGTTPPGMWNPVRALRAIRGTSKNPANTSVLPWAGRLFALCEIGRPFEVDPRDLRSIGETDLDGVVPRAFSAHPHRVAETGYVYNIGTRVGRPNAIDAFTLRPNGTAGRLCTLPLDTPTLIHDFAATARHLVVFVAPLRLKLLPTLLGRETFVDSLTWEPERGSEVVVIPLDAPSSPVRFRVDPFWAWHVGNAFERDGAIVIDVVRYRDWPTSGSWPARVLGRDAPLNAEGELTRLVVDPARRTVSREPLRDRVGEFPRVAPAVDGRAHRTLYWTEYARPERARDAMPDTLVRVDTEGGGTDAFTFDEGHVPSEAVFAPRPGATDERDGWLLTQVYDATSHTTYYAVLDAAHIADGPVCTAHLDHHVPIGFHGAWIPSGR
ncbi:MAG TPA: carotenoid oxygenase family protein [Sandaracinaceae bacterium LLY-WYZ-13_1]|nr:carotenoid oxygenase family protein [Sandaracinaceae bacterium LLY-WYZ-13_1]